MCENHFNPKIQRLSLNLKKYKIRNWNFEKITITLN